MSVDDDPQSEAHQSWLTTLSDARKNCRLQIGEAAQTVDDPHRAVWPLQMSRRNTAHKQVKMAHIATIDYADQVRPYALAADDDSKELELWRESLEAVDVRGRERSLTLGTLDKKWESAFIDVKEAHQDELQGDVMTQTKYRLLLPVQAARLCYRQLNEIVVELGFAPEAPGGEQRTEITDELVEEVEEWRQQHQ